MTRPPSQAPGAVPVGGPPPGGPAGPPSGAPGPVSPPGPVPLPDAPAPTTRRRRVLLVVATVVAVGLAVAGYRALFGDDGDGPADVAARFVEARIEGDCDGLRETVNMLDDDLASFDEDCAGWFADGDALERDSAPAELLSTSVVEGTESPTGAFVEVVYRDRGGEVRRSNLIVHRSSPDDEWRVSLLGPVHGDLPDAGEGPVTRPGIDVPEAPQLPGLPGDGS